MLRVVSWPRLWILPWDFAVECSPALLSPMLFLEQCEHVRETVPNPDKISVLFINTITLAETLKVFYRKHDFVFDLFRQLYLAFSLLLPLGGPGSSVSRLNFTPVFCRQFLHSEDFSLNTMLFVLDKATS